jgi:hypothetical protein
MQLLLDIPQHLQGEPDMSINNESRITLDQMREGSAVPTEEVKLTNGGTVLVHGHTKAQNRSLRQQATKENGDLDTDLLEVYLFKFGVVEPDLSGLEIPEVLDIFDKWPSADIDAINMAITRCNGFGEGQVKAEAEAFRAE